MPILILIIRPGDRLPIDLQCNFSQYIENSHLENFSYGTSKSGFSGNDH